ncbi:MAG TPA: proline--tRNA ligase [Roseiflexaceae bacterium]|nr:proline--tRNA ligase [Roseiflexaceae bacterium]
MRLSTLFGRTLRDAPAEAEHAAHQLVLRAGLARQLLAGGYALLPLGMRALRRIEAIMHEELARAGAQELRLPVVQGIAAWEQSGRYQGYGPLMLRLEDRSGRPLIVAPTHEEAVADLAAREVSSYRQLPALVYQIHTKYRDEIRARGGLMRMREFTMLDAYSLDADDAGLDAAYERLAEAFERIFARCGVRFVAVQADAGEMGGREPREYMALSSAGEDTLALCPQCGYAANVEVAEAAVAGDAGADAGPLEPIATPDTSTIADLAALLGISEAATAKAVFFDTPERGLVFAVIRGDLEVSEHKLRAALGVSALAPASAEQIARAGAVPGYASPVGLVVAGADAADSQGEAVLVVADRSVAAAGALVAGANRPGYHLRNVLYGRDWRATLLADIAAVRAGDPCARCGAALELERGVEIGHIFKLGTRYAEALGATYLDAGGAARPVVMGSYGIGLERLLQVIVEQHSDAAGIVWPRAVAPLEVHLVALGKGEGVRAAAQALYDELAGAGVAVLYDDREETAGVKFNDADLIGLPLRLVVSERLLAAGQVELKPRDGAAERIERAALLEALRAHRGS